jgi:hypothetical protein
MLFRAGTADNVIVPFNANTTERRDVFLGEIPRKSKTFGFRRPLRLEALSIVLRLVSSISK